MMIVHGGSQVSLLRGGTAQVVETVRRRERVRRLLPVDLQGAQEVRLRRPEVSLVASQAPQPVQAHGDVSGTGCPLLPEAERPLEQLLSGVELSLLPRQAPQVVQAGGDRQ